MGISAIVLFVSQYWHVLLGGMTLIGTSIWSYFKGKKAERRKQLEAELDRKKKILKAQNKVINLDAELLKKLEKAEKDAKTLNDNDYASSVNKLLDALFKRKP